MSTRTVLPRGDAIIARRTAKGWSQERLVDIIEKASSGDPNADRISVNTLQNLEKGRPCFRGKIGAVARALECSVEDLIIGDALAEGATVAAASAQSRPVRVAILASGNLSYARDITNSFQARLEEVLGKNARQSEFVCVTGPTDPDGRWEDWCRIIDRRAGDTGFDYFVTAGTQASCALRDHLAAKFGERPFIFLGVTDPVRSGLVASLTDRQEDAEVAGVGYGPGMGQLALRIRKAFPDRRLAYVFCNRFPQDKLAAEALRDLGLYRDGTLKIVETTTLPTARELEDEAAVYFSWYTFELLYERAEGIDLLSRRLVVATTRGNVRGPGLAAIGVGGDDKTIGQTGADIVLQHLRKPDLRLGTLDVIVPKLHVWINDRTARELGVELGSDVRADAEVFNS
jgi:ABC-type uncharacterized transport system substrate-binding protein